MERFKSIFSKYDSVLSFGFTDRDATPPDWEKRKKVIKIKENNGGNKK